MIIKFGGDDDYDVDV